MFVGLARFGWLNHINPNKTEIFEGSFSWEVGGGVGQFDSPLYFKKTLSNINITLYNC